MPCVNADYIRLMSLIAQLVTDCPELDSQLCVDLSSVVE